MPPVTTPEGILLLPAWNEAERIGAVLDRLAAMELPTRRIVVVDDGSKDETGSVARAHGAEVLRHPFNLGYGAALQTGYKFALQQRAPWLVQMDADGQHDPRDVPRLLEPLLSGEAQVVLGSRFVADTGYEMGAARGGARRLLRQLGRAAGVDVADPTTGFQALAAPVLEFYSGAFFPSDYPDIDVLLAAHRRGFAVKEVSVRMSAGERASTLHGGLRRSLYYAWRLALSLWARPPA